MRRLTVSLAFLLIAVLVTDVAAQKPWKDRADGPEANEDGNAGPEGNRPDRPRFRRPGFGGGRGNDGPGNGRLGFADRPNRDPAQMVARMMQQFDKDGDEKLDTAELTQMFTMMQRRGGRGMQKGRPGQGRPGEAGKRRRRPGPERPATPGGDKPQRPPVEE